MHCRLGPVLAKVFGYVLFIGIILRHYYNLAEGLQQYACKGEYGYQLFQKGDSNQFYNIKLHVTANIS